jgi:hypothetical protein
MRRLDRSGIVPPADWDERLRRNLPDRDAFFAKAAELEALDLNDPVDSVRTPSIGAEAYRAVRCIGCVRKRAVSASASIEIPAISVI